MTSAAPASFSAGPQPGVQRSFTAPIASTNVSKPASAKRVPEGAETLFAYHTAKVISFRTSTTLNRQSLSGATTTSPNGLTRQSTSIVEDRRRSLSGAAFNNQKRQSTSTSGSGEARRQSVYGAGWSEDSEEQAGTLPWRVKTESNLASGAIYIYHVPGSATFLLCGPWLKPILPRSKCWCVDGQSIFAIKLRDDNYNRIELPYNTEEDKEATEALKKVLSRILQYETTACPFARGFYVELPERKEIIFRPWKPKHTSVNARLQSMSDDSDGRESSSRDVSSDEREFAPETQKEMPLRHKQRLERQDEDPTTPITPQKAPENGSPYVENVVSTFEDLKHFEEHPFTPASQRQVPIQTQPEVVASPAYSEDSSVIHRPEEQTAPVDMKNTLPSEVEAHGLQVSNIDNASLGAEPIDGTEDAIPPQPSPDHPSAEDATASDNAMEAVAKEDLPATLVEHSVTYNTNEESTNDDVTESQSNIDRPEAGLRWMQFDDEEPTPTVVSAFPRSFTSPVSSQQSSAHMQEELPQHNSAELSTSDADVEQVELEDGLPRKSLTQDKGAISRASSIDSFHSTFPPISRRGTNDTSPELPADLQMSRPRLHKHTDSEITLRPSSSDDDSSTPEWLDLSPVTETFSDTNNGTQESPGTLPSASEVGAASRQSSPASLLKKRLHQRRALSPMPPASILYDPRDNFAGHHLTSLVLQTTYQYILGPSAHLLSMMLNIAARIPGGGIDGDAAFDVRTGRRIPCSWESDSDGGEFSDDEANDGGTKEGSSRQRGRLRPGEAGS